MVVDTGETTARPAGPTAEETARKIAGQIAAELGVQVWQVSAAIGLLDDGATVPFVARYRKEVTGTLDDAQLRTLTERLGYLRELEQRREAILESIHTQGKLTPELETAILAADSKARLEDIYLPYKPKRRTKAQIAREQGLEPLADTLLSDPAQDPQELAGTFVDAERGVADAGAALEGARAILVERFGEDADLIGRLRERMWDQGRVASTVREGKETSGAKYSDYFAFSQGFANLPSHRVLAMLRGEKEEVLDLSFDADPEPVEAGAATASERMIAGRFEIADHGRPADRWLLETVRWAWRTRILVRLGLDVRGRIRAAAEDEAIRVFATNLRDLLLAAPAGSRATMGLDPGLRTGVKVAVVDATGKVAATSTIYPHEPRRKWDESLAELERLARAHGVELIAIGNGTASRETDKLAGELVARVSDQTMTKVVVSEAGASVYSASAYASRELPDMDVSLRGAVSIARRLQDPLAELVKIDPKSIGVGQYQHDLPESSLARSLDGVVEDCVNAVGVDVNTASAPLLRQVSGIGETLAANIVAHRDSNGPFASRARLRDVPLLGAKAFEQCAGFLRIRGGDDPLDASGVHPEAYPLVRRILTASNVELPALIGNRGLLTSISPGDYVDETFGLPTVQDILAELDKPGRDPRPEFRVATFAEGIHAVSDLTPGLVLEGVVTNVAAFGAFVDVGVHQDGLVHVSAMSKTFVKDPREVVKPGDVVRVKVMEVDLDRQRISLTLRLEDEPGQPATGPRRGAGQGRGQGKDRRPGNRPGASAQADGPGPTRPQGDASTSGRPAQGRGPRPQGGAPRGGRPGQGRGPRPGADASQNQQPGQDQRRGNRPVDDTRTDQPGQDRRPANRPIDGSRTDRPGQDQRRGNRPVDDSRADRPRRDRRPGNRPGTDDATAQRPGRDRRPAVGDSQDQRPGTDRSSRGRRPADPSGRRSRGPVPDTALADALRRAGLLED